ncbi:hemolysin II HlyII [Bacillus cereus group sp. Bc177]|uniref:hemolysin II HlyII n=1 Tax=Bacillus cereus group sp. Bc177 TaxID=3018114 RepID=UPI0022E7AED9|nr:hemolysin II HlyII [Bacillus cereus group sp. Bc177]MDA2325704.1 hemolysin II HlyII [Bacillus cereus group sp. Bc177]
MKKVNGIAKYVAVASVIMSGTFGLQTTSAFADSKGTVENLQNGGKVYNSFKTTYDMKQNIKNSIKVSFIEDPYADKKIAIVTTDGSNIDAKYTINGGYYNGGLKWPSAYHTEAEITSDDSAQFHKAAPVNTMTSAKVSSEVGYTLGGSVKVGVNDKGPNAEASITGSYAWKESVSYDQADYKTVLETQTDKKLNWKVGFQSFNFPEWGIYNRDSFNTFYGNQLFMKSRSYNEGTNNFVSKDTVPALTGYGFSPNVVAVITADKTEATSDLKITNRRISDQYNIEWVSSKWWGTNNKDTYNEFFTNHYKLDWNKHQVTLDNQKALEVQKNGINSVNEKLNKGKGKLSFSMNGNQLKATSSNAGYGISYADKNWGIFVNGEKVYTFNEKTTVGNISNDINKLNIKGPYIEVKQI